MRGEILSYDSTSRTGLISGDDGARYSFSADDFQSPTVPASGIRVDFVADGDAALQILALPGAATTVGVAGGYATTTSSQVTEFDWQHLLLSFDGRIRRSHFWVGWLIVQGLGVVISWIPIINLLGIVLIWPNLAISVKRLHDMGRTGWLIAIPWVASIVSSVVGVFMVIAALVGAGVMPDTSDDLAFASFLAMAAPGMLAFAIAVIVPLLFWLWIGLVDSQPGENRFGPNPKGIGNPAPDQTRV